MRVILTLIACCLLAGVSACGVDEENGNGAGPDLLQLDVTTWDLVGDALELDLKGPLAGTLLTVTYYIFGSDEYFGDTTMIPLGHQRLNEQGIGPLAAGENQLNVDLSPWSGYTYIYIHAVGAEPALAIHLAPGKRYELSVH
jgi:hypothetical protein